MWSNKHFKRTVTIAVVIFIPVGAYLGVMSALDRAPFLNFAVVDEGKLMRSAQPLPGDLEWIMEEHGLGTVISLRGRGKSETRVWARDRGIKMIMIQMYNPNHMLMRHVRNRYVRNLYVRNLYVRNLIINGCMQILVY